MKFYVNISQDGDGYTVIDSITDYPIISEYSYTLFWDTDRYGWITGETMDDLNNLISKDPSLLYNGYYEVLFEGIDEIEDDILKEIFGTSDYDEIENNIDWEELIKKSKDKFIFPKKELDVKVDEDYDYHYVGYTQRIDAKNGKLIYIGRSPKELAQFIKDNCYK